MRRWVGALLAVCAVVLSGCGGEDGSGGHDGGGDSGGAVQQVSVTGSWAFQVDSARSQVFHLWQNGTEISGYYINAYGSWSIDGFVYGAQVVFTTDFNLAGWSRFDGALVNRELHGSMIFSTGETVGSQVLIRIGAP